ncbi:tRNA pseudouridine(55) synthase TruB [Suttonella sp. R2A3]|uniref:tRNA pseudouridine(55) synthase TruB n=1 Tax=Suttonella sp. R2A3 TaxID=2908648 RepID=UPI001F2FF219|nr:tRNA pseudouridine(55) synthase TruB [Suttonella sp. R2A3]UJF24867.1 tRNA pseudouridine(55) synthase TruB [Suttonella sp. R2A3]
MARRRKGRALDGILLLDKPIGISSNQALQRVRGMYQAQKAGHGGTLDPFASGLLPVLFGEATKFGSYLLDADKSYEVTLRLGAQTDTDDIEGAVLHRAAIPELNGDNWQAVCDAFLGEQQQMPPIYSALKVGGQRAYDLARRGEHPELAPRSINVSELSVLDFDHESARLRVRCSKGTYIRALVRDIGAYLGSAAHAIALRRVQIGHLPEGMHPLEQISDLTDQKAFETLDELLLPLTDCVSTLPKLVVPAEKIRFIRHGNDIELLADYPAGEYALYDDDAFFGVGRVAAGRVYPERLCRLNDNH